MTYLRSLSDLFKAAMKLAAACAFATAIAAAAFAQTNTFPENGNAGVGTTSPAYPLTVNQTGNSVNRLVSLANDSSGSSAQSTISFFEGATEKFKFGVNSSGATGYVGGANAFQLWQFQNAPIIFGTNGSERMRINGAGNIGIGTTSSSARLEVKSGSTNANVAVVTASDGSTLFNLFEGSSGDASLFLYDAAGTVKTALATNPANATYFNGGKVGIGTATPTTTFHVIGDSTVSNNIAINGATLKPWQAGKAVQGTTGALFLGNFGDTHVTSNAYTTSTGTGWKYMTAGTAANFYMYQGSAVFRNAVSGSADADVNWVNRMVITANGNVGINQTSPQARLSVLSDDSTTNNVTELLRLSHTTTGTAANDVGSRIAFTAERASGIEVLTGYIDSILTDATNVDSALLFHTRDNGGSLTERVRIDSVGNVGIGTTPGALYRLDVQGKINSSELCIATDCKSSWSQVGGGGGPTSFSSITAGTNTATLLVDTGGSLGVSGLGTINATSLSNAANITSGTVPTERLGSGTANNTTFLRGDNTWAAITSSQWTTGTGNISYTAGNVGIGVTPNSSYKLDVAGNINSSGTITGNIINAKYQDLAEWVPSSEQLSAGTVVVLDTTKSNQVVSATVAYDTRVAGVISAQPGITLGESGEGKVLVATTGRVRVKVDAARGPIQIGDLLVTSDVAGVAMKSEPVEFAGRKMHMPGTIIGKALEPLAKGSGEILVLLSLQ